MKPQSNSAVKLEVSVHVDRSFFLVSEDSYLTQLSPALLTLPWMWQTVTPHAISSSWAA